MIALNNECKHENHRKHGRTPDGKQRYRCRDCGTTFTRETQLLDGMRIGPERAAKIIELLCEGMSVKATARVTDTDEKTIFNLLVLVGERCKDFMLRKVRQVIVDDIQIDEIWSYIFCKEKTRERKNLSFEFGDCYTAVERSTKMIVCWHYGKRDSYHTERFAEKLRDATAGHFHLSSDGWNAYKTAIPNALAGRIDYGQIIKIFGADPKADQTRYSPAAIKEIKKTVIWGNPDEDRICTSHNERHNGSMRNFIRRMTRLAYCFSKKAVNHEAMLGLYFLHYNFCRKHRSLKGDTPAMAQGFADDVWSVQELIERTSTK